MEENKNQAGNQKNQEKQKNQKLRPFLKKHPFLAAVFGSMALGSSLSMLAWIASIPRMFISGDGLFEWISGFLSSLLGGALVFGGFIIFPVVLVGTELYLLAKGEKNPELYRKSRIFDIAGIVLGIFYSLLYLSFSEVVFSADWQEQLVNRQSHTPVYTGSLLTVIVIAAAAVIGYFVVDFVPLKKMPPLAAVLGMAAMYLGTAESIFWGIQVVREPLDFFLVLFPAHCMLLTARTVRYKIWEWQEIKEAEKIEKSGIDSLWIEDEGGLAACNRFLENAERWPLLAFLLMWPLLGILIGILLLFGQRPDAVIKAFTETSDWNLSQRIAPQNIYYDEHYLCTVAAGGHKGVVKPKRLGIRHGHPVIVNRQLCVANAFEQVLEERMPRFHRVVRRFYDRYGFPVAKLIHSKYTADVIYFLMKPLEWVFLIVLYLTDVNPENRIAIQYTGRKLRDFGLA